MLATVRGHFKPEFLNRLDDLVVFGSLSTEELTLIVDIQIGQLGRRLVQTAIGDQLARQLLSGDISDGDTVLVDLDDHAAGGTGALTVTRA